METCKDCIHYDVCSLEEGEIFIGAKKNGFCGKHKDKSRFIELPCKGGDIVYVPYEDSQTIEEKRVNSISLEINEFEASMEFNCKHNYVFLDTDINRRVFLTREEAEKALKERELNENL